MGNNKHNLLFVDDEEDIIEALYDTFGDSYNVFKTTDPREALNIVNKEEIAVILSDQRMPEMTGSELLAEVNRTKPETLRVLLTGYADMNAAIDAINEGAIHKYVEKPWDDEELLNMVSGLVDIYEDTKEKFSLLTNVKARVEESKKRESSFNAIFNNLKEGVCGVEEDGKISFANKTALTILGYGAQDEMISKNIFNISSSDLEEFMEEFKKSKKVKAKILSATAKDSSAIDVLLTPVFDEEKETMAGMIFQGI